MSQQPEPPASIEDAVRHCLEQHHFAQKEETMRDLAQAVWDALLAEGRIEDLPSWNRRVRVIPLPVVEPRDTEQDIWESPDGQRAEKNCRSNCRADGHPPCLTCMESLA